MHFRLPDETLHIRRRKLRSEIQTELYACLTPSDFLCLLGRRQTHVRSYHRRLGTLASSAVHGGGVLLLPPRNAQRKMLGGPVGTVTQKSFGLDDFYIRGGALHTMVDGLRICMSSYRVDQQERRGSRWVYRASGLCAFRE